MEKQSKNSKKKAVLIICVAACAICVLGLLLMGKDGYTALLSGNLSPKETNEPQSPNVGYTDNQIDLWDPDFETDIFTLDRWLEKNRYITYSENGASVIITDGKYAEYGDTVEFMADYFDALMHGDAESLNGFYADSYFDSRGRYESITMQKIYDIRIEFIKATDSPTSTEYVYKVSYKILENDGTFRSDMPSDAERPQFYTVADYGSVIQILSVDYSFKK